MGQKARHRRFPHPALAGKNIAVADALEPDGVLESFGDVPLPDDFREALRTPRACNNLIQGIRLQEDRPVKRLCRRGLQPETSAKNRGILVRLRVNLWHTEAPATVASFRTWRGLQVSVAQSPKPDTMEPPCSMQADSGSILALCRRGWQRRGAPSGSTSQ